MTKRRRLLVFILSMFALMTIVLVAWGLYAMAGILVAQVLVGAAIAYGMPLRDRD